MALRIWFAAAAILIGSYAFAQEKPVEKPADKPGEKQPVAPVAPGTPEKLKFEPKFEVGKPFYQSVTTDVEQNVRVQGGNDLKLKHSQTFFFMWTPMKIEGDKTTVKLNIQAVKLKVEVAGNPVSYDSTADNPNAGNQGLNDFFRNLLTSEFAITYGKGFIVEKVEGQDALIKNLGVANQQMEQLLKKILTAEALKEMSDPLAGLTPPTEKGVGDKWQKTTPLKLGPIGDYERQLSFEYKGKDKEKPELERIEVKGVLSYKPPTAETDGLLFRIKSGDLTTQNPKAGFYLFDAKTGRVAQAELAVEMSGTLNVAIGTTETSVQLLQKQTTTILSSDKSYMPAK